MMPSHQGSTEYSQHLCDTLLSEVQTALGKADTHRSVNWCSCSTGAFPRFCYVQHNRAKIKVFLKAQEADRSQLDALLPPVSRTIDLIRRTTIKPGWSAETAYFVDIQRDQQIAEILPLLVRVAGNVAERSVTRRSRKSGWTSPSEIAFGPTAADFWEGGRTSILVNRYERDTRARNSCIREYGSVCSVCGFDFVRKYGAIGAGFIHVHHLIPLSSLGEEYRVNPITDLRPVCPNCHEMLHRQTPPLSIAERKTLLLEAAAGAP
jgi:5-methylcytosine-specific restriction endonuclease McrA